MVFRHPNLCRETGTNKYERISECPVENEDFNKGREGTNTLVAFLLDVVVSSRWMVIQTAVSVPSNA